MYTEGYHVTNYQQVNLAQRKKPAMTMRNELALFLGFAVGFIIAWSISAGSATGILMGLQLIVLGAIIGFVIGWLIDEAYRQNRELRRQLSQQAALTPGAEVNRSEPGSDSTADTLATFLRQRDQEVREVRTQLTTTETELDQLQDEFKTYQHTHPDDLTVIKGIGPVYQWKLRDLGINSYKQLVSADPDQLRRQLDIKKWQRVNIESWIEQARDWA